MTERDDVRERILARRQRFIGLALAGAGLAIGCDPKPVVCLSVTPEATQSSEADRPEPQVCLSIMLKPENSADAPQPDESSAPEGAPSASATPSASASTPPTKPPHPRVCLKPQQPRPRVCLKPVPQPVPRPCLKPVPPKKTKSSG